MKWKPFDKLPADFKDGRSVLLHGSDYDGNTMTAYCRWETWVRYATVETLGPNNSCVYTQFPVPESGWVPEIWPKYYAKLAEPGSELE